MKVIIDIPKEMYNNINNIQNGSIGAKQVLNVVKNGTPIPDNATNSDVTKALFDVTEEHFFEDMVDVYGIDDYVTVGVEWWNAPYQKGGKE